MSQDYCKYCNSDNNFTINTYKRDWHCCRACGTSFSQQKKSYPLSFLPFPDLGKQGDLDEEKMYDYFIEQNHIDWSEREGREFIKEYLEPAGIDVEGKSLLDISGGNGHFIKQIEKMGARITLTEINQKTIEYAGKTHGFDVLKYNLNSDDLPTVTGKKFDVVLARACLMFAKDLSKFAKEIQRSLCPGGVLLINHSVIPTLGVMLRTQLDEHSYFVLRQPETIIEAFQKEGFVLRHRADETDPSLYAYDNDLRPHWRFVHRFYEKRGLKRLLSERNFSWPARDRRRSTLMFQLPS